MLTMTKPTLLNPTPQGGLKVKSFAMEMGFGYLVLSKSKI